MTPQQFISKWKRADLSERSAAQQHFLDLCELLGQDKPADADPEGAWYTFERGVHKTGGGEGWADVWMRGHFAWEYKRKRRSLAEAYEQLLLYREALENPPLLVVCDLDRFEIHTNFTGTAKRIYAFDLDGLAKPANLDILRKVFTDPEALRPEKTTARITEEAAALFTQIADGMRTRGIPAPDAAHFLMKLIFCMFAEDIGLLPEKLFTRVLTSAADDPPQLAGLLRDLFEKMGSGGYFGADRILHFNGGLFADADVIELRPDEIRKLIQVSQYGWENVEPSIFGTLFERLLDPSKRSQIGAHYTSKQDILTLVEPVLMAPLRREWAEVKAKCEQLWPKIQQAARQRGKRTGRKDSPPRKRHDKLLHDFVERLAHVTVLDPACGSGNFLYVAINLLLDLEKEVIAYAAAHGLGLLPQVRPTQLAGIEINPYAQQLAQVVIWIGYLQWMHHNGFRPPADPVLEPIESVRLMDAVLDLSDPENPKEPQWPAADVIVGNPPFLGGKLIRAYLEDKYVDPMYRVWNGRVSRDADICCYWFEKARGQIEEGKCKRAGLLATQGIRGGANREILKRIKQTGDIFFAESDRDWILDGANVHISMVGFDDGTEKERILDGTPVAVIHSNLTALADITQAKRLLANLGIFLRPPEKGGKFELNDTKAIEMLRTPNPNGRPNSDVVRPWINAQTLVKTRQFLWIVDFPEHFTQSDAAQYELPFQHVEKNVKAFRANNRYERLRNFWWLYRRPGEGVRDAQRKMQRILCTPMVSKHRVFVWLEPVIQPDKTIYCFASDDDYFFGLLHSRIHEVWALKMGTRLETRPRYTPTTCFETFPFPEPTPEQQAAIASAARELDTLRDRWLNPPEWTRQEVLEFPGSVDGPWARYIVPSPLVGEGQGEGRPPSRTPTQPSPIEGEGTSAPSPLRGEERIGTVRYPRLVPKDEDCAKELAKRTLTNLYNQRPTWLDLAHKKLDEAVSAAYGWDSAISDDQILENLLALNLRRKPVGYDSA